MSLLLPEGIDHVVDAPYTWHEAMASGLRWLQMYENSSEEEVPPKRIWLDVEKWNTWWAKVRRERDEKYSSGGGDPEEDPNATYENNDLGLIAHGK